MDEPEIAAKVPAMIELEEGKTYWFCTCGKSGNQPLCDGAHKGCGMAPLKHVAEKSGKVAFCQCKRSDKLPFCDGTHRGL